MKKPSIAEELIPVNEFRANMAGYLKQVSESGRPLILTQRGRATAVVVDPSTLDEIEEGRQVVRNVMRGLDDAANGRVVESETLFAELENVIQNAENEHNG